MPLAIIGLLILSALVGWGFWMLSTKVKFEQSTPRYRYEKQKTRMATKSPRSLI